MTFSIAFIDPTQGDYTPDTPRRQPLGGSQSALCYLTEQLGAAGLAVTLVNGTRTPGVVRGVRCVPMAQMSFDALCGFAVVVLLNSCAPELVSRLRTAPGERRLVLWTQHAADEPAIRDLADPALRACWDGIAFVSQWQMETYRTAFALEPARCAVLRNGIAPAFAGLFQADESVLAAKPWPPVLAYTSAPFRGLSVLLDSLPHIRAALPGTRLRVFSSLAGYQVPADADPYHPLYQRCRDTEGVEYVGALAQTDLADELKAATSLAYLNRFAETSCIAAMEAMAAGCLVVSSQLGALAETTNGFARLIPVPAEPAEHALRFAEAVTGALGSLREDRPAWERRLREQVNHATATMGWAGRAQDWQDWLGTLRRPMAPVCAPPVIEDDASTSRITANIAQSQTHLLNALHAHLNAGAQAGDGRIADPRWQAEAQGLIALVEGSLRLDHNAEDRRSSVWATLRGYDAWLAHRTVLPTLPRLPVPPGGRRVYDCFQFHNELELLEVRLAELFEVVDRFVLVEATYTHAGASKPLHYADNRARFAAYADKIIHVVVADDPGGFAWQREAHQREAIARGLAECSPSDLIIVGDADEILRAPVVERLRHETDDGTGLFAPHLDIFLYFLDLKSPEPWVSVAAAPWTLIQRIGPNRVRYLAKQGIGRTVPNAGWHFTWMGGFERFRTKLDSFAHREMIAGIDGEAETNLERLRRFYATGRLEAGPVPGMWTGLTPVPVDAGYPALIRERLAQFRRMGWLAPKPVPDRGALLDAARGHAAAGRAERAADAYRCALALDPACIDAFDGLATLASDHDAPGPLRRCVVLDPWGNFHRFALARACLISRRHAEALDILLELIAREPDDHRVQGNLAVALKNLGRYREAEAAGRRSLALQPAEPGALSNLGIALSAQARHEEAACVLRRAVALAPDFPDARLNLTLALVALGQGEAAEACCRAVLDQQPDNALAHLTLATCLLRRGELERGFAEYEWRTRLDEGRLNDGQIGPQDPGTPPWRGEDPRGRTILLQDEQGLGDNIQFVRYAAVLHRLGARVIVACDDALVRLFATADGVERVVARSAPVPPHDAHAALMSLPHLLGTTLATIPAEVPYLRAEADLTDQWRTRLVMATGVRVGLVWAGNPDFGHDPQRSLPLAALLPLMEIEGVSVLGLQKGGGRRELDGWHGRLPPGFTDLGDRIGDFADTAAILATLDLVISVDTAVAHLAGALGRPVWTLLRHVGDWRWLDHGVRTPWYPTMRLFRQDRPGSWDPVVARVKAALMRLRAGPAQ
ncbi:tetratricopeptide repeat protein [Azospirillum sp. A1-3]|uniref:tetratricopeptide repeat protein n=1 Tax=Azospirillum sp. A1-3 TaxID=185874 RepID=UPI00207762D4|nr:tetratricopeptide repeat protein [Azospirillum sp. A1-3]MCM8738508.1 tetratricopeptide repeat protein [Azospirillum sp. A1-3]